MKQVLREPLLHFFLFGALIFVTYSVLQQSGRGDQSRQILITQGETDHLATIFAETWRRPPTPAELEGLVRDRVREEVYYREAVALGLDKGDTIVRRRLRQKLEFISDDIAAQIEPTDAELNTYLRTHPKAFWVEPKYTFQQVYLRPERHKKHLARDVERLLALLNQAIGEVDLSALGDPFLLGNRHSELRHSEVAKLFGEKFAARLREVPPGSWQGPIESGYGVHLVFVTKRVKGHLPALSDVRDIVRREWSQAQRLKAKEEFYEKLLRHYTVIIESFEPSSKQRKPVENVGK